MSKIIPIEDESKLYSWTIHYHPMRQKWFLISRDYYTQYWSHLDRGLESGQVIDMTTTLGATIASRITREIAIHEIAKNKNENDTR